MVQVRQTRSWVRVSTGVRDSGAAISSRTIPATRSRLYVRDGARQARTTSANMHATPSRHRAASRSPVSLAYPYAVKFATTVPELAAPIDSATVSYTHLTLPTIYSV